MSKDHPWPTDDKEMDLLCASGKSGWELCAATSIQWYIRYYFKREVIEKQPTDPNRKL